MTVLTLRADPPTRNTLLERVWISAEFTCSAPQHSAAALRTPAESWVLLRRAAMLQIHTCPQHSELHSMWTGQGPLDQVKTGVPKVNPWALLSTFIGRMAFLMLSQQHRSTEGVVSENVCVSFESCECSVTGFFATNESYFSFVDIETDGHASVLSQIFFNSSKWA